MTKRTISSEYAVLRPWLWSTHIYIVENTSFNAAKNEKLHRELDVCLSEQ